MDNMFNGVIGEHAAHQGGRLLGQSFSTPSGRHQTHKQAAGHIVYNLDSLQWLRLPGSGQGLHMPVALRFHVLIFSRDPPL